MFPLHSFSLLSLPSATLYPLRIPLPRYLPILFLSFPFLSSPHFSSSYSLLAYPFSLLPFSFLSSLPLVFPLYICLFPLIPLLLLLCLLTLSSCFSFTHELFTSSYFLSLSSLLFLLFSSYTGPVYFLLFPFVSYSFLSLFPLGFSSYT